MHWHKGLYPDTSLPYKTYRLCLKAKYIKTLLFWGKIVEFYAKIVKNRIIYLVYTFVDALAHMFVS